MQFSYVKMGGGAEIYSLRISLSVNSNIYGNTVHLAIGHTHGENEGHSVVSNFLGPHGLYSPWNSPGQNSGVGRLSLLQGLFPTLGSNPGLLYCRRILYQLSHKGSPRILEWVAYPFSRELLDPGIEPRSPALQMDSLPAKLSGKPMYTVGSDAVTKE